MSYSFSAKGDTKQAALMDAETKFDKVVTDMPIHALDRGAVMAHARSCLDVAGEPNDGEEVTLTMHGSMWQENPGTGSSRVRSVSIGCSVGVGPKPVPTPTAAAAA